jgi:hypothetical protein
MLPEVQALFRQRDALQKAGAAAESIRAIEAQLASFLYPGDA